MNNNCIHDYAFYLNERLLKLQYFMYDIAVLNDNNEWFYNLIQTATKEEKNSIITAYENAFCEYVKKEECFQCE